MSEKKTLIDETKNSKKPSENNTPKNDNEIISFSDFLENTPPGATARVNVLWGSNNGQYLKIPVINIHCEHEECNGKRNFLCTSSDEEIYYGDRMIVDTFVKYQCGNCRKTHKRFSLNLIGQKKSETVTAYKYGEVPKFGERVPNRLIRYMNESDQELFFKGIACQNHGHGIAAVAYFRRVVENIKNEIFDRLIEACKTQGGGDEIVAELEAAKNQTQFDAAVSKITKTLPAGLMIDGHNPMKILYRALSINLHSKSDSDCLENAKIARKVLEDLVERIHLVKVEDKDLKTALSKLMQEKRD